MCKTLKSGDDVITRDGKGFIVDIMYSDQIKYYVVLLENNKTKEYTRSELKVSDSLEDESLPENDF